MMRSIWFFARVAAIIAVALWLADNPGTVAVDWQGYLIELPFAMAAAIAALAIAAAALVYRGWVDLRGLPARLRRDTQTRKRDEGYEALTRGMVAVAAGDATNAKRFAKQAESLLEEPPLTMLLSAQAAQLNGEESLAHSHFTAMLENPETVFLGVRGLLSQAMRRGNRSEALALARRADALQPNTPWVLAVRFDLEARAGSWANAAAALHGAIQAGIIDPERGRHHHAVLLLELSREAETKGNPDAALGLAQTACDQSPGFAPAAARFARLLLRDGQSEPAARVIEQAWRIRPHPELADAYADIAAGQEPLARVHTVERLRDLQPDSAEAQLALAKVALLAGLWVEARSALKVALSREVSARVLRLLADLEKAEHGDGGAARDWLAQAAGAPPGPAWTCRECGCVLPSWQGLCANCGAFDSLDWTVPSVTLHLPSPHGGGPVPLLLEAVQ